ncbi:MAG: sigma-70 family RNA polymerase sigma factor [Pseudomonadota bacterium]
MPPPIGKATSDEHLLQAMARGQSEALGELYDRYAERLMPVAVAILRNSRDAEDLIHDVFLEAWQKAASFDAARGSVRSWLSLRVRSRAIDRLRALNMKRNHAQGLRAEAEATNSGKDDAAVETDCALAQEALGALSDAQREVIELGYFRGLSCSEIASHCGIPLGTVKSRLGAALNKLRQHLKTSEGEK